MPENLTPAPDAAATPAAPVPAPPAAAAPTDPAPEPTDWKAEARKWEQRAKENRQQLDAAAPKLTEYDRLVAASKSELERAQETATAAEAKVAAANQRAVNAEVKAFAAGTFADPDDAAAFLAAGNYLTDSGDVDTAKIQADLADLLTRKPHLGKTTGTRTPAPNPAQGASASGPTTPAQLSLDDVKRMSKAGDHAGIEKARQEGRLSQVLGQT